MLSLIVGLGNPGDRYQKTRHNAGFWLLDRLATAQNSSFHEEKKFFGEYCKIQLGGRPLHLLKPQTFMNASGRSVAAIARFYHLNANEILVAHDELDLPEGIVKLKFGGGHGGHNGLRDIISALGSKDFYRLRLGIDHPHGRGDVVDYVLKPPSKEGRVAMEDALSRGQRSIELLLSDGSEKAMHWLHTR